MVAKQLVLFALAIASAQAAPVSTSLANTTVVTAASPVANYSAFTTAEEVDATSLLLRPTCPTGWGLFNVSDVSIMKDVPLPLAWAGIGKFCEVGWQGFDLFDSKGSCDSVGAIRTYGIGNFKQTDHLDHLFETPSAKSQASANSSAIAVPAPPSAHPPAPHKRRSWTSWLPFGWADPNLAASPPPPVATGGPILDSSAIPHSGNRGKPLDSASSSPAPLANSSLPAPGLSGSKPPTGEAGEGTHRHSGVVGHTHIAASDSGPTQFHAMLYSQIGEAKLAGAKLSSMVTLLKLAKVAGGTEVTWDVVGCSDTGKAIEALLKEMHAGAIANAGDLIRGAHNIKSKASVSAKAH